MGVESRKTERLRVQLTGQAQTAYMKLPEAIRGNYGECIKVLKRRFAPDSRRELYVAELSTRRSAQKRIGPHLETL